MRILLVAAVLGSLASCADDGVRHTPDATSPDDAAADAAIDAPLTPAMLSGSPGATAFGDVVLGQATAKVPYTISNDGEQTSGTIGVLLDSPTAGFTISENTCSGVALAPHETCTFNVSFQPSVAGLAMTTVRAGTSPGGEVARDLTGTGLQPGAIDITEASHDYLTLAVDATAKTHTFTIKNSGQVVIGVPMPEITGTVDSYSIASTTCTAMLAPMATCSVVVHFDPPTVGMKPGSLVVTSTPGGSDSATVAGTGFAHIAVAKTGNGGGTVTSSITGISCGSGCAADFTATPVALTAAPANGSQFAGWTGDCTGTSTCSLDLTAHKTVTAAFNLQQFVLTASTTGNGQGTVTTSPAGISCGAGNSGTCSHAYDYNTPVTVTATPVTGSTFAGFNGACTGPGACVVTMTQARSVTATFTADPEMLTVTNSGSGGTVTTSPAGISCGTGNSGTCSHAYDYGTPVTVTATPVTGWTFAGFTGACTGPSPCVVTMTQARSVTATFTADPEMLTVTNSGSGGTVTTSPAGISCGAGNSGTCSHAYDYGTPVTVTATPATGWTFAGFTGACTGPSPCVATMTQARSITATFAPQQFTLTTATAGTGQGTVTGAGTYDYNTPVTVTATPATGSTFAGWSGACTGPNPCVVTMTSAKSVTATFTADPETLTVTNIRSGGTVTSSPAGISCAGGNVGTCTKDYGYGTPVTLTATPDVGAKLGSWGGACANVPATTPTCTVPMDQARSVSVTWLSLQYKLNLSFLGDGAGTVTVNGTQYAANTTLTVNYNDNLVLTETPGSGAAIDVFGGWDGACASFGTQSNCTLTVTGTTNVSATFLQPQYRYIVTATTATANGIYFQVTYPPSSTSTAECSSTPSPGTNCAGSFAALSTVTLKAHVPPPTFSPYTWNTFPTWGGCDSVSADGLTCTFSVNAMRHITVSGDSKAL